MNGFDDIFDQIESQRHGRGMESQPFDVDAWAEKKKAERTAVYGMADSAAAEICRDENKIRDFLDVQARFDRYSATNALLIYKQMPDAVQIRDFEGWKDMGMSIKRRAKSISIIEPGNEYEKEDGTIGISYNVKKVFDVTQTSARNKEQAVESVDDRTLLKALINNTPVPVKTTDALPDGVGAFYDHDQGVIFVRRGMDAPDIFRSVSLELAHAELAGLRDEYSRKDAGFAAYCASYLLCKKYGIDVSRYDFSNLPEGLRESEPRAQRDAFSEIRDTAANISMRMTPVLEQSRSVREKDNGMER